MRSEKESCPKKELKDRMDREDRRIFQRKIKILASDADAYQRLRLSTLMRFLQEISIAHTEALGCTKEKTLDRGFLWVITGIRFEMLRPVLYDEEIVLVTWSGETRHVLFPRYFRIFDQNGDMILNGSSIWLLIDGRKRSFLFPARYGIEIPGISFENEMTLPEELSRIKESEGLNIREKNREACYSDLDLNGHVNNTRYLDWIDDLHSPVWHKAHIPEVVQINFRKEIRPETSVRILYEDDERNHLLKAEGEVEGNTAFSAIIKLKTSG